MIEESGPNPKTEAELREKLDKELAMWRDTLHKENLMLEKMLASLEALEKKISQPKKDSTEEGTPPEKE